MDEHEPWPVIIIRLIIKDAIAILRWQKALLFSTGIRGRFLSFPTRNKRVSLFFFFLIFRKKKRKKNEGGSNGRRIVVSPDEPAGN